MIHLKTQRMKAMVQRKVRSSRKIQMESMSTLMKWKDMTCCMNTRKSKRSLSGSLRTIRATSETESPCQKPSTR